MLIRWFAPRDFIFLFFRPQAHPTAVGGLYFFSILFLFLLLSFSPYSQPSSRWEEGPFASLASLYLPRCKS